MRLRPSGRGPRWHWPVLLLVISAIALLTIWTSDRTGEAMGTSCVTEGLDEPVCSELRGRNEIVFLGGMGLIVITALGYRVVVDRRYGGDPDNP